MGATTVELGNMLVRYKADLSDLQSKMGTAKSEMRSAEETANSSGGGIIGAFQRAGGGLLNFVGTAGLVLSSVQQIGQTAVGLAASLLGPAASAETMNSAFTTLLGSQKAANAEMATLDQFAAKTNFTTLGIDKLSTQLLASKTPVADVVSELTAMGDELGSVGRGTEANMGSVANIYEKIRTEGKLTIGTMSELSINGIDAWTALEKATGKTKDELTRLVSAGLIPAGEGIDDLTKGIEANPLYAGGMARQSQTMTGLISTLKSNWDQMLTSLGSPILKALEPEISNLGSALASPQFKDFASGIGQKIVDVFGQIAGVVGPVIAGFEHLGSGAQIANSQFGPMISQAEHIYGMLGGQFVDAFKFANEQVSQIATWAQKSGVLGQMGQEFQNLAHVVLDLSEIFVKGRGVIQDIEEHAFAKFAPIIEKIAPLIVGLGVAFDTGVSRALHYMTPYIEQAEQAFGKFAKGVTDRLAPIAERWMPYLLTGAKELQIGWNEVFPYLEVVVKDVFGAIAGDVEFTWALVSGIINVGLDVLGGNWGQAGKDLQDMWHGMWDGINTITGGGLGIMVGQVTTAGNMVNTGIIQPAQKIPAEMHAVWGNITSAVSTGGKNLLDTAMAPIRGIEAGFAWLCGHNYYFKDLMDTINKDVSIGEEWLVNKWDEIKGDVVNKFTEIKNDATNISGEVWSNIVHIWDQITGSVNQKTNEAKRSVTGKWDEIKGSVSQKAIELWANVSGVFSRAWNDYVAGPIGDFGHQVFSIWQGWASNAVSWGENLIKGFVQGIENQVGNAGNAANDVMKNVSGILGFHSPAKEGEGSHLMEWGPGLIKGFSEGMINALPTLQSSLNLIMQPVASTLSGSPRNDAVYSHAQSMAMMASSGGGAQPIIVVHVHNDQPPPDIYVDGQLLTSLLGPHIANALRLEGGLRAR